MSFFFPLFYHCHRLGDLVSVCTIAMNEKIPNICASDTMCFLPSVEASLGIASLDMDHDTLVDAIMSVALVNDTLLGS